MLSIYHLIQMNNEWSLSFSRQLSNSVRKARMEYRAAMNKAELAELDARYAKRMAEHYRK